jgi:hypothetical protein
MERSSRSSSPLKKSLDSFSRRSSKEWSTQRSSKTLATLALDLQRLKRQRSLHTDLLRDQEIRGELRRIERKSFLQQRLLAIMVLGSLVLGVLINESCAGGDYRETYDAAHQAYLEDPDREPRKCVAPMVTTLKMAQSALTICLLLGVLARFRLRHQQTQVNQRLHDEQVLSSIPSARHSRSPSSWRWPSALELLKLLGELVLCSVHTLPFFHVDFRNEALGRKVYYRSESVLCGFMFVRLYHVYLFLEQSVFLNYFDLEDSYLLKDYNTVKLSHDCATNHTMLAFKVAMTRNPGLLIMMMVGLLLSSTTYIVRLAEGPAYMPHSQVCCTQSQPLLAPSEGANRRGDLLRNPSHAPCAD